ncbi:ABC transporter substrate-binding protein [Homoserinibacter sp. GY 40078]|uniref:ABC transporter substrate-binding protein n=1 Tax=Homoserinibacter sp. GY 40078 TaxID=2603275 RepID=UPI0011CB2734|nr:ABC transporter substrate-binding protein [Homoserinibacter sp. GY 40078]TXK19212.1 amino acid ABC transporter substrate-binding protein [Homoserinibacter sp. GY 40078]
MTRALPARIRRASAAALVGGALAALTACTAVAPMPTPTPTPTETVAPSGDGVLRIGTLFPTTGATSFLGAAQVAGVNAAAREINAAGGVLGERIEIVNRNSGSAGSDTAKKSFAALVEKGVDVIIGPSSSAIAEELLPLAAEAGIPLISPAATYPQLTSVDADGMLFRTIPSYPHQGTVLGPLLGDASVALITGGDAVTSTIESTLAASLEEAGGELVVTAEAGSSSSVASAVSAVKAADPDVVVLATIDNGDTTQSLITKLTAAGLGKDKLWLTSQNLADYSQALPAGTLTGAHGVLEGVRADDAFRARLEKEDPGLSSTRYAPEAYDAVIIAALAATMADDDGGPSIRSRILDVTREGIRCSSFGECLDVLTTEPDIAYEGITGPLRLDDAGDPTVAVYGVYEYSSKNRYARAKSVSG